MNALVDGVRTPNQVREPEVLTLRSELRPWMPLSRGKPLARSPSPLRTLTTLKRARRKHTAPRDTGFSPQMELAVRKRTGDGDACDARCESCGRLLGRYGGQVERRQTRPAGSLLSNTVQNAVLLCDGCHIAADQRDPLMGASGFLLASTQDPREVPVRLHSADGPTLWLTESGTYSVTPPEHEKAASGQAITGGET